MGVRAPTRRVTWGADSMSGNLGRRVIVLGSAGSAREGTGMTRGRDERREERRGSGHTYGAICGRWVVPAEMMKLVHDELEDRMDCRRILTLYHTWLTDIFEIWSQIFLQRRGRHASWQARWQLEDGGSWRLGRQWAIRNGVHEQGWNSVSPGGFSGGFRVEIATCG
jgi:hypothetical protein